MQAADYALTMTEDDLQVCVEDLLTTLGYLWFHDEDSRRNEAGLPDLIAVHERTGFLLIVELKKENGKARPKQARWLAALRRRQRQAYLCCIWRPSHWRSGEILRVLRQGAGVLNG